MQLFKLWIDSFRSISILLHAICACIGTVELLKMILLYLNSVILGCVFFYVVVYFKLFFFYVEATFDEIVWEISLNKSFRLAADIYLILPFHLYFFKLNKAKNFFFDAKKESLKKKIKKLTEKKLNQRNYLSLLMLVFTLCLNSLLSAKTLSKAPMVFTINLI